MLNEDTSGAGASLVLLEEDHALDRRPAGTAIFLGPVEGSPAAPVEDPLPADRIFLARRIAEPHPLADLVRQIVADKSRSSSRNFNSSSVKRRSITYCPPLALPTPSGPGGCIIGDWPGRGSSEWILGNGDAGWRGRKNRDHARPRRCFGRPGTESEGRSHRPGAAARWAGGAAGSGAKMTLAGDAPSNAGHCSIGYFPRYVRSQALHTACAEVEFGSPLLRKRVIVTGSKGGFRPPNLAEEAYGAFRILDRTAAPDQCAGVRSRTDAMPPACPLEQRRRAGGRLRDVAPALLLGSGFLILLPSTVFADDSTEELKQLRASLQKEIAALKKQEQKLHQEFPQARPEKRAPRSAIAQPARDRGGDGKRPLAGRRRIAGRGAGHRQRDRERRAAGGRRRLRR